MIILMTGAYFLSGGHGLKDDNQMPQFVEICPAYGCGWTMIYEDPDELLHMRDRNESIHRAICVSLGQLCS